MDKPWDVLRKPNPTPMGNGKWKTHANGVNARI